MAYLVIFFLVFIATGRIHNAEITHRVYFDIEYDGENLGQIAFALYGKLAPKAVENFRALCTGENGVNSDGVKLHFKDTGFHKISKGAWINGGNIDGKGGVSIYGKNFSDENFSLSHSGPGMLSMASSGPDSNNSQFYITTRSTPWLDDKNVIFGEVVNGFNIVKKIEEIGSKSDKERQKIKIVNSGEFN